MARIVDEYDRLLQQGSDQDRLVDSVGYRDVFDRESGAELAAWELRLQKQFRERLGSRIYRYRGFVHHTREVSLMMITPSPWLLGGVFVHLQEGQELPPDGAFIEITGQTTAVPTLLQRSQTLVRAIAAESLSVLSTEIPQMVSPPLALKDLSELLFEHVGIAEASKGAFARLFVSSPPYKGAVGGLTMGIQALAAESEVKRLLAFVRKLLPPTFRTKYRSYRSVEGIDVGLPRLWRLEVGRTSEPRMESICVKRVDPLGYRELSLGALTDSKTAAFPDIPLAVASGDFWIEEKEASQLMLPLLKAAITFQLLTPIVTERTIDSVTKHIISRLEILKDTYDLSDSALARGGILDADSLGRPLSALRLAQSTARAEWRETVNSSELKRSWDQILEPALKEFIETSELSAEKEKEWGPGTRLGKYDTKILRALKTLDEGTRGSLGPTLDDIAGEASIEKHVAAESLTKLKDAGAIYEPRTGHYRVV
ncbi:MAG: hypothetical protein C4K47_07705 [Candidatus Thorarchaeota archaeon]|nr:MAG: hypothetical protein C4K47_07705 [Candidatus Thorarchaeota archaeon]